MDHSSDTNIATPLDALLEEAETLELEIDQLAQATDDLVGEVEQLVVASQNDFPAVPLDMAEAEALTEPELDELLITGAEFVADVPDLPPEEEAEDKTST